MNLDARLEDNYHDEISTMAEALNTTAAKLAQSFAESEDRRRELAALLDSMQEAVVAITPEGYVSWSNSVMQRLAGTQIRQGRSLVHTVRDPDVLACAEIALRDRTVRSGRSTSLLPGRTFEINATPMPGGGAVVVLHDVTSVEAAEKIPPRLHRQRQPRNSALRSPPSPDIWKPSSKTPTPNPKPPANSSPSSSRTPIA